MSLGNVLVVKTAIGADGNRERLVFGVNVVPVEMGVGAKRGEYGVADGGQIGETGIAQELFVGGFGGRDMVAAELRRAGGRDDEQARQRQRAAAQFAGEFEGDDAAEAVS